MTCWGQASSWVMSQLRDSLFVGLVPHLIEQGHVQSMVTSKTWQKGHW